MTTTERLHDAAKQVLDAAAIGTALGTVIDQLPAIAAALSIVWTCIRIHETATVQRAIARVRAWIGRAQ